MGMFVEALIDPDSGELLKNEGFRVLATDQETEATVYQYNISTGEYSLLPQPLSTDSTGNARFWANPGLYYITRGSVPTLVEVFGAALVESQEGAYVPLTNQSTEFSPDAYAVVFRNCYRSYGNLGGDLTITGPFPEGVDYYYEGSTDITVTFNTDFCYKADWTFTQVGTGKITIAVASGKGTRSNFYGHTKTAGPKAVILVKQVKGPNLSSDGLEYVISGITA